MKKGKATVVLVAFYNIKALGVRYLEASLIKSGYHVISVFYKDFNSIRPKATTDKELSYLSKIIADNNPLFVGYSIMSSMYLDTVDKTIRVVQQNHPNTPTMVGGAYPSLFPERFLDMGVDYAVKSDGENAVAMVADYLYSLRSPSFCSPLSQIPSLCYKQDGKNICNDVGGLLKDIDGYDMPAIEAQEGYYIEDDKCIAGDPQISTMSYEVVASRGCPFTCTYCSCLNLGRLLPKGINKVRSRSVRNVIEELRIVQKKFKKLVFVHFYDEIFPTKKGWLEEFVAEYKKHINLPFVIWSHPKMVKLSELQMLVDVGLMQVIMGIQSGSDRVRNEIFHRYETREEILKAAKAIHDAKVRWASYDFMLQHPFETLDDLKETYYLVKEFTPPFDLQMHGMNFLPGTDIVQMAIDQKLFTADRLEDIMYAPMETQFEEFSAFSTTTKDPLSHLWYKMTYCLQFPVLRSLVKNYESDPSAYSSKIIRLHKIAKKLYNLRDKYLKGIIVLRSLYARFKMQFKKRSKKL